MCVGLIEPEDRNLSDAEKEYRHKQQQIIYNYYLENKRLRELLEECYRYISRVSDDRGAFSYDKELTEKLEKALEEK